MADEKLIKFIQTTFGLYGLTINKNLSANVARALNNHPDIDVEAWLTQIVEQILTQNLATAQVSLENIKLALKECFKPISSLKETETVFNVIDAFNVPKIIYDLNKQKYVVTKVDHDLFPDAKYKSLVFKERLDLLWYRTQKHAAFAPSKFGKSEENKLQLVPIDFVLSESKTKDICIMGLLAQITEGQYWLEDYSGKIKINLKDATFNSRLIMEGSIVLVKGKSVDGIFQVEEIDFPPAENSENSRAEIGDANTFGGSHPTTLKLSEKLKTYEDTNSQDFLIFLSEFWVDNEKVLNKFKTLLSGFSDSPPVAIVLCGHFSSSQADVTSIKKLKEGFKKVASIISEFQVIHQYTKFVFVPGPYDLCAAKILPRPALPKFIMEDFIKIVPNTYLATNPCRLQYCTKEIVIFRENMISKLCRSTISFNKKSKDETVENHEEIFEIFAKSILRQSHLTPLLFSTIPVFWKYDQALQLYPAPDLVVVADDFQPYISKTMYGCKVINPGSFLKSNFSFHLYTPSETDNDMIEGCEITEDDL